MDCHENLIEVVLQLHTNGINLSKIDSWKPYDNSRTQFCLYNIRSDDGDQNRWVILRNETHGKGMEKKFFMDFISTEQVVLYKSRKTEEKSQKIVGKWRK